MRRIPWRLALRYSRKGAITVLGISLAVSFSLLSYAIAVSLERDTLGLAQNHPATTLVISAPGGDGVEWAPFASNPRAVGVLQGVARSDGGEAVMIVALVGDSAPPADEGVAHPARDAPAAARIDHESASLRIGPSVSHFALPTAAFLVPLGILAEDSARVDHVLVYDATPEEAGRYEAAGMTVQGVPALRAFFQASGVEVARDLLLVVAFSCCLAIIFCHEFLRSEVRERRREIGIWRSLGMRGRDVAFMFLARAAAIAMLAIAIGWSLATALSGYAQQVLGATTLTLAFDVVGTLLLPALFLLASLLGGLLPAIVAGRLNVQSVMESQP